MPGGFKDHFSGHSADYAAHRPGYPESLFDWLAARAPGRDLAWDCASGSGQAATGLARHFRQVIATDASANQLEAAGMHPVIVYRVAPAEASGLEARSADLITVAQALHWFDTGRFYAEVRRVARPGASLAVWSYNRLSVDPAIDAIIGRFHDSPLREFWPPERRHVECGYRELPFPFAEIEPPPFAMRVCWSLEALTGYLRTWSAVQRFLRDRGFDPVADIERRLRPLWGEGLREVCWPLSLRVGNVS